MSTDRLASIVITNYNYGRFLRDAIESALNQTHPNTEIVVVDDGSTDESRAIIGDYNGRVKPVLKDNGGMGSTYNAGFPATRGDVVFFLDSDDTLLPTAVESAINLFENKNFSKVHWPLWEVNEHLQKTGRMIPGQALDEGNIREKTISEGPDSYISPPTSGNAWAREFLEDVLPIPESEFRQHADTYLNTLASVFLPVAAIFEPQGLYRVHGQNDFAGKPSDEKNRRNLEVYDQRCLALSKYLNRKGIDTSPELWKDGNANYEWMKWQDEASKEIKALIPQGHTFILVDEDNWSDRWGDCQVITDRCAIPFLEKDGQYWGPPPDDSTAISELERLRNRGATFIVFAWPAFWWLDYYSQLGRYLRSTFRCVRANQLIMIFDLRQ
jgi:glycosyltransferase involved in cell wall biosynthesis